MRDVVAGLLALAAYAAAASKLPAVRRQPGARAPRALFLTLLALAIGWTFLTDTVSQAAARVVGVERVGQLFADCFALATGCGTQAMLVYLTHDDIAGRRLMRPRLLALAGAIALMTTAFVMERPQELSGHVPVDYGTNDFYLAYAAPYLSFLAYIFVGITRLCWRSAREAAGSPFLAAGLRLIAVGGGFGLLYVALRAGYITLARASGSTPLGEAYSTLSDLLVAVTTVVVIVGATLPSWAPRLALYRDVRQLSPLWRALVRRFPDLALAPAPSPVVEVLPVGDVPRRRNRRVIEILDARLELRTRFRPSVAARARRRASEAGLRGEELAATVEAARIAVALRESEDDATMGSGPQHTAEPGHEQMALEAVGGGADLEAETTWLRKVSGAFSHSPVVAEVVAEESGVSSGMDNAGQGRGPSYWAARAVTEVTAPAPVLVALLLATGAVSAPTVLGGLGWGLLAALFFSIVPFAGIVWGVVVGRVTDHHVSQRAQRPVIIVLSLASFVAGYATLRLRGAPTRLLDVMVSLLAAAAVCLLVTLVWKMSMHMAVAGCAAVLVPAVTGSSPWAAMPVLLVVAWSRVRLRDHTPAQTIAGALAGALVSNAVFSLTA